MRRNQVIETIWKSGLYIGRNRPDSRVTVQDNWKLHTGHAPGTAMLPRRQPARWFQDSPSTQVEIDLPAGLLQRIAKTRDKGSDAAQLTLTLLNVSPDGGPNRKEQGRYSQRRGFADSGLLTATGRGRWPDLDPNEWSMVTTGDGYHTYGRLAQGVMLRTYQGYGGYRLPREDALDAGFLEPTGIWIIDTVDYDDQGNIEINARDTGQLLVDPIMYPPFMGRAEYPMQFYSRDWNLATTGNPRGIIPERTNYQDLADVVKIIAIWSGFWLKGAPNTDHGRWPAVLGGIETTGMASTSILPADMFDKKAPIDAIKQLEDIVSYQHWIDQNGGLRWSSPNIWEAGNFDYDGVHHEFAFDLDEYDVLMEDKSKGTKQYDRSQIIAAMADPYINGGLHPKIASMDTFTSTTKNQLHGIVSPAIIAVTRDIPLKEMITLAELTNLRIWFARRSAGLAIPGTPLIDVDDQVRVWERVTFDHYLHNVTGITDTHDLTTGEWKANLTVNWMGADNDDWAIRVGKNGHVIYNTDPRAPSAPVSNLYGDVPANRPGFRSGTINQPTWVRSDEEAAAIVTPIVTAP